MIFYIFIKLFNKTHPPDRTGDTTRTKGGSKGKLSCHQKERKKKKKRWLPFNQIIFNLYFFGTKTKH